MATKDDAGKAEVQKAVDKAEKQGFIGVQVDPTPNENYTVAGVTGGKPTPETSGPKHDPDAIYAGDTPLGEKA